MIGVPSSGVKSVKLNGKMVWKNGKYLDKILFSKLAFPERLSFELASEEWQFLSRH